MRTKLALFFSIVLLQSACSIEPDDSELLDGPIDGLTTEESIRFLNGDAAFNNDVFTTANGLGPLFVATSCGSCHAGDGKGHPFAILTRFGQTDTSGNQFLHLGGPQLQHRAIPGYLPEQIPESATFSSFLAPANTGLGFLELISDGDILALADPTDANADGISGEPNWIHLPNYVTPPANAIPVNGRYIGRFGKKAAVFNLLQQTANAYNQDMGITSLFEPIDTYTHFEIDPEITTQTLLDVVFYLQTLKVPPRRNATTPQVLAGQEIFISIGCAKCHTPTHITGPSSIAALSNVEFHPYTDLLLHDMGPGLDDGYTEGVATTAEWRTPPLWGLGLAQNSQGGQLYLMHDGRANSIHDAIMMHGGEATQVTHTYEQLTETERQHLIHFLNSL
jgi:CxxC motif-containing protein (DUF1111 family)